MTEKDREIQELRRELELSKAEINRLRECRDRAFDQIEFQRKIISHLMEAQNEIKDHA